MTRVFAVFFALFCIGWLVFDMPVALGLIDETQGFYAQQIDPLFQDPPRWLETIGWFALAYGPLYAAAALRVLATTLVGAVRRVAARGSDHRDEHHLLGRGAVRRRPAVELAGLRRAEPALPHRPDRCGGLVPGQSGGVLTKPARLDSATPRRACRSVWRSCPFVRYANDSPVSGSPIAICPPAPPCPNAAGTERLAEAAHVRLPVVAGDDRTERAVRLDPVDRIGQPVAHVAPCRRRAPRRPRSPRRCAAAPGRTARRRWPSRSRRHRGCRPHATRDRSATCRSRPSPRGSRAVRGSRGCRRPLRARPVSSLRRRS